MTGFVKSYTKSQTIDIMFNIRFRTFFWVVFVGSDSTSIGGIGCVKQHRQIEFLFFALSDQCHMSGNVCLWNINGDSPSSLYPTICLFFKLSSLFACCRNSKCSIIGQAVVVFYIFLDKLVVPAATCADNMYKEHYLD